MPKLTTIFVLLQNVQLDSQEAAKLFIKNRLLSPNPLLKTFPA